MESQKTSPEDFTIEKLLNDPLFGEPVTRQQSENMITKPFRIHERHSDKLRKVIEEAKDPEALRFYFGEDSMFFFSKENLQTLLDSMENNQSCAVIYCGSRKDEIGGGTYGRPTLILCAYNYVKGNEGNEKFKLVEKPFGNNKDLVALEHPGGDGKLVPKVERRGSKNYYQIHDEIKARDVFKFAKSSMREEKNSNKEE